MVLGTLLFLGSIDVSGMVIGLLIFGYLDFTSQGRS